MKRLPALIFTAFTLLAHPVSAQDAALSQAEKTQIFESYTKRLKDLRQTSLSLTLQMTSWDIVQGLCTPFAKTDDQKNNLRAYTQNRKNSENVKALVARIESNEDALRRALLIEMNEELGTPADEIPARVASMTATQAKQRADDAIRMRATLKNIWGEDDCAAALKGPAPFDMPQWMERRAIKNANMTDDPEFNANIEELLK